jgi:hypothetical protein
MKYLRRFLVFASLVAAASAAVRANHSSVVIRQPQATATATMPRTPGATPTATPTPQPPSTTLTGLVEAEIFNNGGEGAGYHDVDAVNWDGAFRPTEGVDLKAAADGGGYYVTRTVAGEWLAYWVTINAAGHYRLQVRVASVGPGGVFHVELDGTNLTGPLTVPDTGGLQAWHTITRTVALPKKFGTLRLVMDQTGPSGTVGNFNYMGFALLPTPRPSPMPGPTPVPPPNYFYSVSSLLLIPGTIEAEDFQPIHGDTGYFDSDAANLGGQFRTAEGVDIESTSDVGGGHDVSWTKAGEWLEYAWGIPLKSGQYVFRARVASAGAGGQFHLEVDGVNVTGTMIVPNTGGAQKFQTLSKTVEVTRPLSGAVKLRLVMDGNGPSGYVGAFNHFSFDPGTTTGPTPPRPTPRPTMSAPPTPTFTPTTPRPTPTSSVSAWQAWKWYPVGSQATYSGVLYRCLQAHTSQPDWTPPAVPALWQRP